MLKRLIDIFRGRPNKDVKLPWEDWEPSIPDDVPLDQTTAPTRIEGDTSDY